MLGRVHLVLLRLYGRLPQSLRLFLVRRAGTSYTVGAFCVIERSDGAVLLVRQSYRSGWGLPGGLAERGEAIEACARREAYEELGLDIELVGEPSVVVDAPTRRVDVVFRARPGPGADPDALTLGWPEILAASWFPASALPAWAEMQPEAAGALATLARSSPDAREPGQER